MGNPSLHGLASRLGNLELDGSPRLLLHHHGARRHLPAMGDIGYPELHQVAGTELRVDCEVEEDEVTDLVAELKANANSPDVFQLERCLLPDQLALIPGLLVLRCVKNCHDQLLMKGWSGFSYAQKHGVMRPAAVVRSEQVAPERCPQGPV